MNNLNTLLPQLAERYETAAFILDDPSQFMHRYKAPKHQERAAFIAAALSYGSRKQFIPRIDILLRDDKVLGVDRPLPDNDECFYRLHTNRMVRRFINTIDKIEASYGSLGEMMRHENIHTCLDAVKLITGYFAANGASDLIPKNTSSACKRVCMFMRWMVRDNSPVDLGLWSDQIDKSTLIMPMDTHVLQEALRLGLIESKTGSMDTAIKLSNRLKEIFPDDPTKADFALFGLGVDEAANEEKTTV